ncbi:MAG: twin-arginine translocase TatA/TatE family subunit [Elusimicrobia bacterium]|nr:twin-arginine translocase TatA/TatE family subunit [Elusimicrobiota bacterium]
MGEFSPMHWLVVLVVALLIFGPKRIPEIAKSLGEGIREFKKSMREGMSEPAVAKAEPAQIESKGQIAKP